MDRIKAKLEQLRVEADTAVERAEKAEAANKALEQELLGKEQDILSLTHKVALLEAESEKTESALRTAKEGTLLGESSSKNAEDLTRKVAILEDELDKAEKNVKETMERLRQVDVKAEHYERQVAKLEQEREVWEKKYEDERAKYKKLEQEMQELESSLGGL